jgi:hypothetical protein
LATNWPEVARLLLAADVDSSGRVRLADVSAALQRLPELSALTPASASTIAALLDVEGSGSIRPDSVSWTFAFPIVKRWLTPRCSDALEIFKRVEMDRGAWLVFCMCHCTMMMMCDDELSFLTRRLPLLAVEARSPPAMLWRACISSDCLISPVSVSLMLFVDISKAAL